MISSKYFLKNKFLFEWKLKFFPGTPSLPSRSLLPDLIHYTTGLKFNHY